jgi:O-acetylserine/cysteine efflux transporter
MNANRRYALIALAAAGLLWGTTVPLSKVALEWLSPGWLVAVRFAVAAAILLPATRSRLRAAFTPGVFASGAIGYGGTVLLQNAGIDKTSVSHAALLIGAVPVMVAVIAVLWHRTVAPLVAWAGFAVSLAGVALVAGGGGHGATLSGDGLIVASLVLSAVFTVAQGRVLEGRDPVAVTAVQFLAAAVAALPFAAAGGLPGAPAGHGPLLAVIGLTAFGTLAPFTLFAFGQSRVSAEVAGAFLNLEPLVGAIAGVLAFGDPAGPVQLAGGAAILAGIGLSSLPLLTGGRTEVTEVAELAGVTGVVEVTGVAEVADMELTPSAVVRVPAEQAAALAGVGMAVTVPAEQDGSGPGQGSPWNRVADDSQDEQSLPLGRVVKFPARAGRWGEPPQPGGWLCELADDRMAA